MPKNDVPTPLWKRLLVSAVGVILALYIACQLFQGLAGMRKPPAKTPGAAPPPMVRAITLQTTEHAELVRGYGIARALRETRVSAEVVGVVREVAAELRAGRRVFPPPMGEQTDTPPDSVVPLVTLDTGDFEDALSKLVADRAQNGADRERVTTQITSLDLQIALAAEQLETAEAELERILSLVPKTLTESDADRQRLTVLGQRLAKTQLVSRREQSDAELAAIEARDDALDVAESRARRDLARTRIYAPFAGRVRTRLVEVGARVGPGTPLFDLVDVSRVEVAIRLPASRYDHVEVGNAVALRLAEGSNPLQANLTVARIAPDVDAQTRTFQVFVEVEAAEEGTDAPLPPGAHVIADVAGKQYDGVLVVPREAFLGDVVYVVERGEDGEGAARERRPAIHRLLPAVALVLPGTGPHDLRDGDEVVTSNLEDMGDGTRLRVAPPLGAPD